MAKIKIAYNVCYGGYGLSEKAMAMLSLRKGMPVDYYKIPRDDQDLIEVIEMLGKDADGKHAKITILEIEDTYDWLIDEYDGFEWVVLLHKDSVVRELASNGKIDELIDYLAKVRQKE